MSMYQKAMSIYQKAMSTYQYPIYIYIYLDIVVRTVTILGLTFRHTKKLEIQIHTFWAQTAQSSR